MAHDIYESPLATRNASPPMLKLFSPAHKFGLWRKLWLELARCERELGISRISEAALTQMAGKLDDIDFDRAAHHEKRLRHDVMAHVHTFEEAAPAAKGIIHLGATSMDIVDTADQLILREAMQLVAARLANVIDALGAFAIKWKDLPTLGYTHFQPAQLTTVGKRATLWAQGFVIGLENLEYLLDSMRFRGLKGATGTQASFLALFNGDHGKVDQLEQMFAQRIGFSKLFEVSGQTYPREFDALVISGLANVAASVHRFCNDVRLLAGIKQMEEPFETDQVGSSAMAYKRNPQRCERATGLARFVISLSTSPLQTAAEQWFERTLDDSSNKRLTIPEPFLAIDGCLNIVANVAQGLVVYPKTIEAAVLAELPFMATEEILMAAVRAGGDRQELHESIRKHSLDASEQVKAHGRPNDLMNRLGSDATFAKVNLGEVLNPSSFVGRSPEQVERFVEKVVDPIRKRYKSQLNYSSELRV